MKDYENYLIDTLKEYKRKRKEQKRIEAQKQKSKNRSMRLSRSQLRNGEPLQSPTSSVSPINSPTIEIVPPVPINQESGMSIAPQMTEYKGAIMNVTTQNSNFNLSKP